jgi:ferritin
MQFSWLSENVAFRSRRDVLRFLYCHEWMHWYLHEQLKKGSSAETACDRFALRNFRRPRVTISDADAALTRPARVRRAA